jgi:hydroxyacylglutathione hydrolase
MDLVADSAVLSIERYELGSWATNSYHVVCRETGKSVLVDVPPGALTLIKELKGRVPDYILLTHSHIDHITGLKAFKARVNVPVAVHKDDEKWMDVPADIYLKGGDEVQFGKQKIDVMHTPGHTPGSLCFRLGDYLISGDTIFPGGPGKTWSKEDFQQIIESIKTKIIVLPDETQIYPGHGAGTVLKKEKDEFAVFSSRPHDPNLHGDVTWLNT